MSTAFLVGRYSHGAPPEVRASVQEAGVQKDKALVPARFREEVKKLKQEVLRWSNKAEESRLAACEARTALNLAIQGQNDAVTLVYDALSRPPFARWTSMETSTRSIGGW